MTRQVLRLPQIHAILFGFTRITLAVLAFPVVDFSPTSLLVLSITMSICILESPLLSCHFSSLFQASYEEPADAIANCTNPNYKIRRLVDTSEENPANLTSLGIKNVNLDSLSSFNYSEQQQIVQTYSGKIPNSPNRATSSAVQESNLCCPYCSYSCTSSDALEQHFFVHIQDRPFVCSVCGRRFNQKVTLQRHFLTHTGEKPFQCKLCPYQARLKFHMRNHISRKHPDASQEIF